MVVLEKITSIFLIYNHVKDCSALHLEQQLCHAIKNRHFSIYVKLLTPNVRSNNFKGNSWIL